MANRRNGPFAWLPGRSEGGKFVGEQSNPARRSGWQYTPSLPAGQRAWARRGYSPCTNSASARPVIDLRKITPSWNRSARAAATACVKSEASCSGGSMEQWE